MICPLPEYTAACDPSTTQIAGSVSDVDFHTRPLELSAGCRARILTCLAASYCWTMSVPRATSSKV